MLRVVFTLDYEIHGSGMGSPWQLMVEPTERMLEQFDRYGAKLTIMVDVAELFQFKQYFDRTGQDKYWSQAIEAQLRRAISLGHDVQLHIHSGYLNASLHDGVWRQDYADYDLARLGYERLVEIIGEGKRYLETLLRPVRPDYECMAFRAANWSIHPSKDVANALIATGIKLDTSVFKHGFSDGLVKFDYREAYSDLVPWPASTDDLCKADVTSQLFEFPIYCEQQPLWTFLTPNRVYRVVEQWKNPLPPPPQDPNVVRNESNYASRFRRLARKLVDRHPWKMDFNQCTGKQLVGGLQRADDRYGKFCGELPFVLIGHSKTFTRMNEASLQPFLKYVHEHSEKYVFGTFRDFDLEQYRVR